jgi:hypothetical protein
LTLLTVGPTLTQSTDDLTIDQMHLFVMPAGNRLQITEHYLLGNAGDETYGGDGEATVVWQLPAGASDVRINEQDAGTDRYIVGDGTVADTAPIPPGSATVEASFAYELPLEPGTDMSRQVPLPVQSGVLLVAGEGWGLQGENLTPMGSMEVGGQMAQAYTFDPLTSEEALSFSLIEQATTTAGPQAPAAPSEPEPTQGLLVGSIVLVVAGAAAFALWRFPQTQAVPTAVSDEIAAIAALDAQFRAGEMSEAAYREARATLKAGVARRLRAARGQVAREHPPRAT